jgi:hypothetical protein
MTRTLKKQTVSRTEAGNSVTTKQKLTREQKENFINRSQRLPRITQERVYVRGDDGPIRSSCPLVDGNEEHYKTKKNG